jgi:hypothetical protein
MDTEKFRYYVQRYCVQIVIKYRIWISFLSMYKDGKLILLLREN